MKIISCAVLISLALTNIQNVESFCYYGKLESVNMNGKIREYCELASKVLLPVGETQTSDCIRCTCTSNGLSCCGIGYKAGAMSVLDCTIKKLDNCCYKFVHDKTGEDCMPVLCP